MAAAPETVDTRQVKEVFRDSCVPVRRNKTTHSIRSKCSVMMAFFWQRVLLLSLAAAVSVHAGNIAAECVSFFFNVHFSSLTETV